MRAENEEFQTVIEGKRKEIKPLQNALGKLRGPRKEGGPSFCSSEAELDNLVSSHLFVLLALSSPARQLKCHLMVVAIFSFGNQIRLRVCSTTFSMKAFL